MHFIYRELFKVLIQALNEVKGSLKIHKKPHLKAQNKINFPKMNVLD